MKRRYRKHLIEWLNEKDRKPLILRGARQVGKSTLIRIFADDAKLDLFEINLEKVKFKTIEKDSFNIQDWILEIESLVGRKMNDRTLIFIDEIQAQPKAVTFLRYFYEERPDLAVICAGSLLDIVLNQQEISFPVGRVSYLWISPMTFAEYLLAVGKDDLANRILSGEIPDFLHDLYLEEAKKYFFIGGMPKAVATFVETQSYIQVRKIQEEILQSIYNDFSKYEKRVDIELLQSIFQKIAFHLGKKIIYQHVDETRKSREIKKALHLFQSANILTPCYHVQASQIPILAGIDHTVFKLYFLDIGLVNCLHQFSWDEFQEFFDSSFAHKGYLAEQFISQHLSYAMKSFTGPELYYWLKDKTIGKAEIDFIINLKGKITPIEVKAATGGRLKSFQVFAAEKTIKSGIKFSKEYFKTSRIKVTEKTSFEVKNYPYYAIESLIQIMNPSEE